MMFDISKWMMRKTSMKEQILCILSLGMTCSVEVGRGREGAEERRTKGIYDGEDEWFIDGGGSVVKTREEKVYFVGLS